MEFKVDSVQEVRAYDDEGYLIDISHHYTDKEVEKYIKVHTKYGFRREVV